MFRNRFVLLLVSRTAERPAFVCAVAGTLVAALSVLRAVVGENSSPWFLFFFFFFSKKKKQEQQNKKQKEEGRGKKEKRKRRVVRDTGSEVDLLKPQGRPFFVEVDLGRFLGRK